MLAATSRPRVNCEWTTVSIAVTLGAGVQQLTLLFDDGSANLDSINVADAEL